MDSIFQSITVPTQTVTKPDRAIESICVNPINGCIIALCNDKTTWIHEGQLAANKKQWRRIADIPPTDASPFKENEDDITTTV